MSGTFPSTPAPRSISFGSLQPTRVSRSHSLKRQARTSNAQHWLLSLDFTSLERADMAPIYAFLIKQRGRFDTFEYVLPTPLHTPRGTGAVGSPSPFVDGGQVSPTNDVQLGRTILTRGWTPSATILRAMDFLKFASHSKVYMAVDDVTADSSGRATITIEPALRQSLSHGDAITTHNIPFTVARALDESGFELSPASIFDLRRVDLVEEF